MSRRCRGTAGAALLAALLLAACATRPADPTPWINGRLSVQVEAMDERSARSFSSDFELRGGAVAGELRLTTALGTSIALASWSAGDATLDVGQGPRRFDDLDALSRETLGEAVPLRAFPDWLAGRPWPGAGSAVRADGFEQLGWAVSLAGWAQGRIEAVRAAPPRVVVRVRLERTSGPAAASPADRMPMLSARVREPLCVEAPA